MRNGRFKRLPAAVLISCQMQRVQFYQDKPDLKGREKKMSETLNQTIFDVTQGYLEKLNPQHPNSPVQIEMDILDELGDAISIHNASAQKGFAWKIPQKLNFIQIAEIMARLHNICCVKTAGATAPSEYDLLAIYQPDGPDEGIYVTDIEAFRSIAKQYNYTITDSEFRECLVSLRNIVAHKEPCMDRDLIAVNNGIFDYETKQLMPFSPNYIFMSKSRVNYNDRAYNVTIHNPNDNTDWDVEGWMDDLSDDPEIVHVLWQVLGAIIRPHVSWNQAAWLYSESGNNGKGTLCVLMQQLCGEGSYTSLKLSEMSKDFALEPLIRSSAIITDENDVGAYIDKAANLKSLVTGDSVTINRKFKQGITYKFHGFMVQCMNEMPRIKDKSDSFFRRQLFIPFTKCFTGKERKYIKDDYLRRPEVLEYVLYKVLNMDYYSFDMPKACQKALNEYKEYNDPVRQFFHEVVVEAEWDVLPFKLLYDLYKQWFKENNPSGTLQNKPSFNKDITNIAKESSDWDTKGKDGQVRIGHYMSVCEPLLDIYDLKNWQNPDKQYSGNNMQERCTPKPGQFPEKMRGIYRINPKHGNIPMQTIDD